MGWEQKVIKSMEKHVNHLCCVNVLQHSQISKPGCNTKGSSLVVIFFCFPYSLGVQTKLLSDLVIWKSFNKSI